MRQYWTTYLPPAEAEALTRLLEQTGFAFSRLSRAALADYCARHGIPWPDLELKVPPEFADSILEAAS